MIESYDFLYYRWKLILVILFYAPCPHPSLLNSSVKCGVGRCEVRIFQGVPFFPRVAQLAEHSAFTRQVGGSLPSARTIFISRPHRLDEQDTILSRLRREFDSLCGCHHLTLCGPGWAGDSYKVLQESSNLSQSTIFKPG